jgi:hypothetical protein
VAADGAVLDEHGLDRLAAHETTRQIPPAGGLGLSSKGSA